LEAKDPFKHEADGGEVATVSTFVAYPTERELESSGHPSYY
jgi:hypothetical protein